jgi:HK97 family phage major capsid protein
MPTDLAAEGRRHVAQARAIQDAYEGKAMPAEAAHALEQHLEAARGYAARDAIADQSGGRTYVDPAGSLGIDDRSGGYPKAAVVPDRLRKDQPLRDWLEAKGLARPADRDLDFGRWLKGIATGEWESAEREQTRYSKDLSEGTLTAGGHMVPTPLMGEIIDMARNASVVFRAGAQTVPMTSATLKIPRLTAEGTPAWHAENGAITGADLTFDAVTFTARTLTRLVKLSVELFEDADPSAGNVIAQSFAGQVAQELDRAALRGTGTAPEPRGILNQSGVTITTHGANGAAITNYDFHLDAIGAVRNGNFEPNAHVQAPRSSTSLSKLKEATTNAYMAPPAGLLPMLTTKNIPINLTVGTSTDCTEVYTGQWESLLIGMRTQMRIEFLRERFLADSGEYAFLAWLRADVQLAQPAAFNVDTGVRS